MANLRAPDPPIWSVSSLPASTGSGMPSGLIWPPFRVAESCQPAAGECGRLRPAAGLACSLFSGRGAYPGAGCRGRNKVKATTNARIFDAMFSAIGSGAAG
jgi:hypothetical protein